MKTPRFLHLGPAVLACLAFHAWAAEAPHIDDATRASVLAALSAKISEEYVFPDKAKLIVERLTEKEKSGAYQDITEIGRLAAALTRDLRQPTNDLHLRVSHSAQPIPETANRADRSPELDRIMREGFQAENYGIRKVETLPGNIGYIDLREFVPPRFSEPSISAAMALVADAGALIIDLRSNIGGDPHAVAFMSSYLFDKRTHLNDLYWRRDNRTVEFWTKEDVPGKKFGGLKKVYVLTSKKTFSAAEEFSYNLKQLQRAVIIGETTAGGAHPGQVHRIHPHFSVFIPNGRAINPITRTNWEGTGVVPDVKVGAADALRTAELLAVQALLKSPADEAQAQLLRKRLNELER